MPVIVVNLHLYVYIYIYIICVYIYIYICMKSHGLQQGGSKIRAGEGWVHAGGFRQGLCRTMYKEGPPYYTDCS